MTEPIAPDGAEPPELARCLGESGYTPPVRALPALLAWLVRASEDDVKPLERALARAEGAAVDATLQALQSQPHSERPRLIGLLGRCAGSIAHPGLFDALLGALDEPHVESRKLAARGLGKLGDARAEERLLAALDAATPVERKNLVDALGALGGEASLRRLPTLTSDDADFVRRRERARLLIERRAGRAAPSGLRLDTPLPSRWRIALECRAGLAELLAAELSGRWAPELRSPARVDIQHAGRLDELLAARIALDVALVVPLSPGRDAPEQHIAAALARPEVVAALEAWTGGVPRFRVAWAGGGHRRALTWSLARALREHTTAVVNDSHAALWTLRAPPDGVGELLLVPRLDPDPRFAYRSADVPAASHPTIAAALARFAGVQPDEVVWDPFVGSGLELIERARLAPVKELWGSDIDSRALAAARRNLEAAGLHDARLLHGSALEVVPGGNAPSLIISNPPMGRRVARDGSLGELLEGFVEHAARLLRPGGRLVWLSPLAERTERQARRVGLTVTSGPEVDLGGFSARLQRCTRPA